jgi:hypothetical protein
VDRTQWRVVLSSSEGGHEFVQDVPAPRFDEVRHAGVCSEVCFTAYTALFFSFLLKTAVRQLKFLYVAITRARKNLWIVDCSEKGEPMRVSLS